MQGGGRVNGRVVDKEWCYMEILALFERVVSLPRRLTELMQGTFIWYESVLDVLAPTCDYICIECH